MDLPTISVIVPTRDRPDRLRAAIASVRSQALLPLELLVVDDSGIGQVDDAALALLASAPSPLSILRGEGRGPGAARNVGLRSARGELIAFLDDDDLWHPQRLAWQAEWFLRRPELGLLGTAAQRVPHDAVPLALPPARFVPPQRVGRAALLRANRLVTSSVLVRRRCFDECGGFDESLPLAQDWDMWLRISRRWQVAVLPAELVAYRLHPAQRSAHSLEMRECESRVMRRAMEEETGWLRGVARRRLSWARCRAARARLRGRLSAQATQAAWDAVSLYPLSLVAWTTLARGALARLSPARVPEL